MTFNRAGIAVAMVTALAMLSGCPGQDENVIEEGLTVHVAEVHVEEQIVAPRAAVRADNSLVATLADGGYDRTTLEHHDIVDNASHLFSLFRVYLVIDDIELVKCTSVAQWPRRLLEGIIPTAAAHAGHGAEPVGGRALDKSNVIDIVTQDEFLLALGDMSVAPGRYCGARVSLARLTGSAYGEPDAVAESSDDPTTVPGIPNMSGKAFVMRADYCSTPDGAGGCSVRSKVDIDDTGLNLPGTVQIEFDQALELSETARSGYVAVGIAYGEWVANIDVSLLSSDSAERQKLIDNIAGSFHAYSTGLGDLPPNIAAP